MTWGRLGERGWGTGVLADTVLEGGRKQRGRVCLLSRYPGWPRLVCVLTTPTVLPAEACKRTTGQTECLGPTFLVGLCTTVGKASSTDITRTTLCLSSTAFSNGLEKFIVGEILCINTHFFPATFAVVLEFE